MNHGLSPEQEPALSLPQRRKRARLAGVLACAAVTVFLLPPEGLSWLSCAFRDLTGHSCLTCGLTRSLGALARGDLLSSLGYNLMGPPLFLGLLAAIATLSAEVLTGRQWFPRAHARIRKALILFVLAWVTYGGMRLALELAG